MNVTEAPPSQSGSPRPRAPLAGPTIVLERASRAYRTPAGELLALRDVSLRLEQGDFVAVVGRSGSGKSTLLHLLAGIDRPSRGSVVVAGTRLDALDETGLAAWRGRSVGIVFQFFQLLPTLTIAENVELAMDFARLAAPSEWRLRALALLDMVGICDQADKLPATLSGGQQQRAAIARALANDPPILLADEPTGNLDSETAASIWELLRELARRGKTIVAVTHDPGVAELSGRVVRLVDGRAVEGGAP